MTEKDKLAATLYLLGQAKGGMYFILASDESPEDKIEQLRSLENKIRTQVDKLFYSSPDTQDTPE